MIEPLFPLHTPIREYTDEDIDDGLTASFSPPKQLCDHVAGQFLGQAQAKHTDRYLCIKCKQEFTMKWYY